MAVYVSAAAIAAISLLIGGAISRLLRTAGATAPALGLSACVVIALIGMRLPGEASTAAAVLALAAAIAVLVLVAEGFDVREAGVAVPVGLLLLLACSLPFLAYGRIGELGPGFSADLALHMGQADALRALGPSASVTVSGYPIGPHTLVAAVGEGLGLDTRSVFLGLLLAIPVLTGLTALAGFDDLSPGRRVVGAALVGLPYLPASYFVQASFKELVLACCFLAFVLILRDARRHGALGWRRVLALLLATAGGAGAFGLPALAWPCAVLLVLVPLERHAAGRALVGFRPSRAAISLVAGGAVIVAALALGGGFLDGGGAGAFLTTRGLGGNFSGHLSPLEAFGVWPASDFRYRPRSHEPLFWSIVAFGTVVAAYGLAWCWRRRELVLLSAAIGGMLVYLVARPVTLAYNSGKALVIVAPVLTLIAVRALLEGQPQAAGTAMPRRLAWAATALAFIGASAGSTALALRTAVPRPHERADELASLRSLVRGEPTLYLGRSDWAAWDLRGARLTGFQRTLYLSGRLDEVPGKSPRVRGGAPDVDSVVPAELDRYRYVVAPRTAYASAFPPNFQPVRRLRWYVLWERNGPTRPRRILTEGAEPGAVLDCGDERRPGVAFVRPRPVTAGKGAWRQPGGGPPQEPGTMSPGGSLVQSLELGPGAWEISLAYSSPVDLRLRAGSLVARLPADVDDPAGLFGVGGISTRQGRTAIRLEVSARRRRSIDRLIRLGRVAATRVDDRGRLVSQRRACGRYVDWLSP